MTTMIFTISLFYIFGLLFIIDPIFSSNNVADSNSILIQNGFVTCYSDRLVIHWYYFPFGDKTIEYHNIRSCELLQMRDLSIFKYKIWGMALSPVWWYADFYRQGREYYIILDANQWPKIGMTMDDDDTIQVYNLIKQEMTSTTSGKEFNADL